MLRNKPLDQRRQFAGAAQIRLNRGEPAGLCHFSGQRFKPVPGAVQRKAVTEYSGNGLSVTLRQVWQRIEALGRQKAKDPFSKPHSH